MASELTIGQLAKKAGVNIQTVRYYERRKLLSPAARRSSGYRLYRDEAVRRLAFIKNSQVLGFTLKEIAELLALQISSGSRCGDVKRRAMGKLRQVEEKANDLHALARALKRLIRACRDGQPTAECPILDELERERRMSNGSRKATR